ncbi:MAG TPA: hypothetical protein VFC78_06010 [Tepidisphaeraceae bacterium]|nr:hypothetical protein [Tepidisphaeraceae bacterium]
MFLHERSVLGGKPRLVAVDGRVFGGTTVATWATVFRPGSLHRAPVETGHSNPILLMTEKRVQIYAGLPDPTDPSHFTIAYTLNGNIGRIDGWLDHNDKVTLIRTFPAATPPAQVSAARSP